MEATAPDKGPLPEDPSQTPVENRFSLGAPKATAALAPLETSSRTSVETRVLQSESVRSEGERKGLTSLTPAEEPASSGLGEAGTSLEGPPAGGHLMDSISRFKRLRECTSEEEASDLGTRGRRKRRLMGHRPRQNGSHNSMHPRSRFFGGPLNFRLLAEQHPPLSKFLSISSSGFVSFDFKTRDAQLHLCIALFRCMFNLSFCLPPQQTFLVPTLPNRSNYIHFLADLLSHTEGLGPPWRPRIEERSRYILREMPPEDSKGSCLRKSQSAPNDVLKEQAAVEIANEAGNPPRGLHINIFDVGVGANCVYPLLGVADYGWSFVGSDISSESLVVAAENVKANKLESSIQLRQQHDQSHVFEGVVSSTDPLFAASMCNPPFYSSEESIGFNPNREKGGSLNELVCEGGEKGFLSRMYTESKRFCHHFIWFTTLVARATTRDQLKKEIHEGMRRVGKKQEAVMQTKADQWCKLGSNSNGSTCITEGANSIRDEDVEMHPRELRLFELSQGKQTRWVVCWTYWTREQRKLLRKSVSPKH